MKKRLVIFAAVVTLALALSVTAFALSGSKTALIHSEYYSGKCYLTCEDNSVTASMTASRTKNGDVVFGAMAEINLTGTYLGSDHKVYSASASDYVELPSEVSQSVGTSRTVSDANMNYPNVTFYTLKSAECTYELTYYGFEKTLTIM